MPNTYTELLKTTVGTATSSVTLDLTGISGYTDLVVVMSGSKSAASDITLRVGNGSVDTGSNYSRTFLYGDGSSAVSGRQSNQTSISIAYFNTIQSNFILNLNNYSNTTTFKTILSRWNASDVVVGAIACLWRSTAAINIMTLTNVSGNFTVGSTFSVYGIANADQGAAKATGGIITEDSQYWYHTFGASGAFIPKQALTCDYLVVAGGGGGGSTTAGSNTYAGGGGGAGGFRTATGFSATVQSYPITVGAGGAGGASGAANNGTAGSDSVFSTITSAGGGFGARGNLSVNNGGAGGSGGASTNGGTSGAASPAGQGNAGATSNSTYGSSGGGGGASAAGLDVTSQVGGAGGAGTASLYSGASVFYAGGGGGGAYSSGGAMAGGAGGVGGGGAGGNAASAGVTGTVNTGGGGGGQGGGGGGGTGGGGSGGSGIVIIRYAK